MSLRASRVNKAKGLKDRTTKLATTKDKIMSNVKMHFKQKSRDTAFVMPIAFE
jgi:hypothetical protein